MDLISESEVNIPVYIDTIEAILIQKFYHIVHKCGSIRGAFCNVSKDRLGLGIVVRKSPATHTHEYFEVCFGGFEIWNIIEQRNGGFHVQGHQFECGRVDVGKCVIQMGQGVHCWRWIQYQSRWVLWLFLSRLLAGKITGWGLMALGPIAPCLIITDNWRCQVVVSSNQRLNVYLLRESGSSMTRLGGPGVRHSLIDMCRWNKNLDFCC